MFEQYKTMKEKNLHDYFCQIMTHEICDESALQI
jgi:hypothetical protein